MCTSGGSKDRTNLYVIDLLYCVIDLFWGRSFSAHFQVVKQRISEGFGLFKFDGLGGGLGQSGGEEHLEDFEAMLHLIEELRHDDDQVGFPLGVADMGWWWWMVGLG